MLASRKGRRLTVCLLGLLAGSTLVDGLLIEPNRLVRREVRIPCSGIDSHPVRILLFSDVNFTGTGRRERALRDAALDFEPDLVMVAGDLFERSRQTEDSSLLESAAEYLASFPAPAGRFLAPGENESPALRRLREAWPEGAIEVLSNESRSIEVRGERLDLFVADPPADPAPWSVGREAGRSFVQSRGRHRNQMLVYGGQGASDWTDVEITFAYQALDPQSLLDLRFAWQEGPGPIGGTGWRLVRHEYSPDFRLHRYPGGGRYRSGRWESGFVPPVGVWCRARVLLTDGEARARVRARFWRESEPEPDAWSIDAADGDPDRQRRGTVAFAGRAGARRYANLRVVVPGGGVLLEEAFAVPTRLRNAWHFPSALADWVFGRQKGEPLAADPGAARLLLAHDPDIVLDLAELGGPPPCLVLAGHTHGGQVRLPGLGAFYTSTHIGRRYDKGLFSFEGFPLFITSGVGTTVIPIRLFDPPEVVFLTLLPVRMSPP